MMIRMRIMNTSALQIPPRCSGPCFAAVSSEMQVNPAATYMIRMLRMDHDCISIRNLTFCSDVTTPDLSLPLPAIGGGENTKDQIAPHAESALSKRIIHFCI